MVEKITREQYARTGHIRQDLGLVPRIAGVHIEEDNECSPDKFYIY